MSPAGWRRGMTLVVLTWIAMLYAMTMTIAIVALPQIQGALATTQDEIAQIITFNIIATAVATPMTGWLSRRFGRRVVMVRCIAVFVFATLLCGLSTSLEMLVLSRILQGAAGGPLVPLGQAMALDMYPKEKQGPVQAIFAMGIVLGPVLAPVLGGYLSEAYGWRWVFFLIVPFGVLSLTGALIFLGREKGSDKSSLDWTGFIALSLAIAAAQFMFDRGQRLDWFESLLILGCAGVAAISSWIFVVHSLTTPRPYLNPRLLRDRNYALGLLMTVVFGMVSFTPIVLFPTLLQHLRDFPDSLIGFLLSARSAGTFLGFLIMMWASRFDPRWMLALGFLMQGGSCLVMAGFDINLTLFDVVWSSALQGAGVAVAWVPLILITFNTLERRYLDEATSIFHLLRNFGSSVFISISIVIVLRTTQTNVAEMGERASPFNEILRYPALAGAWGDLGDRDALQSLGGEIARQANMIGYVNAFYAFAVVALSALPLLLLVRLKR